MSTTTTAVVQHSREYRLRRFMNWFPLGLTYATFYMGRYNFNVVKGDLGKMFELDKAEVGIIATAGFWTYALSVMFNGPLADRFGGKRAILFGALGAATANLIMGLLFLGGWKTNIIVGMSLLYSANCYFQSFGALSVVKVNSAWFHVRERGVFGGIFGIMISSGYLLAISFGGYLLGRFPQHWYIVFLAPAVAILVMFTIDLLIVKDTPKDAGFENFNTGDASAGDETPVDLSYVVNKILSNPIILTIAAAEFCTGFVRQGLLLYFVEFLHEVHSAPPGSPASVWAGFGVTIGGICGGLLCGYLSDRVFESRRPPVAFIFYVGQIFSLLILGWVGSPVLASIMVGISCMWIFGVHGMLSGTASADFGGRKGAATATGLLDGVQYIASGFTGFGLGYLLKTYGWGVWTYSIIPFSLIGGILMLTIWNAKPQPKSVASH
ncbi:MAG: MFS transporter [Acidobacteriota bacterium]|nr:MFS transporter [Blastocatellia bacterium]MDW8413103.1 MFS transporter [Acidobacteriota bacterium]